MKSVVTALTTAAMLAFASAAHAAPVTYFISDGPGFAGLRDTAVYGTLTLDKPSNQLYGPILAVNFYVNVGDTPVHFVSGVELTTASPWISAYPYTEYGAPPYSGSDATLYTIPPASFYTLFSTPLFFTPGGILAPSVIYEFLTPASGGRYNMIFTEENPGYPFDIYDVFADVYAAGNLTLTPTPLRAALWLFASGLLALGGVSADQLW